MDLVLGCVKEGGGEGRERGKGGGEKGVDEMEEMRGVMTLMAVRWWEDGCEWISRGYVVERQLVRFDGSMRGGDGLGGREWEGEELGR